MDVLEEVELALELNEPQRTAALNRIAREAFIDDGGPAERADHFLGQLEGAWVHTRDDSDAERVADLIANAAGNAAFLAVQPAGTEVTWRTMLDDDVRDLHRPLEGVTQRAGSPFIVGGIPLDYPGQPVGPPEGWINCRCHLALAAAAETRPPPAAQSAAAVTLPLYSAGHTFNVAPSTNNFVIRTDESPNLVAVSDKPWSQFSASDYTIEQWRRACLLKMPGGDPNSKSTYKLPVREPGGALNRNGVHAAAAALAGARGGTSAPAGAKAAARSKLRGLYRQLGEEPPESLAADLTGDSDALTAWAPSTSPPGTHDAPGWITHPRDTQRLRTYWTKGEGAAKIRWGQPGDFKRCERQLRKYIANPQYLAGTCANLHFVALGFWPGQGPHGSGDPINLTAEGEAVTEAFTQAATLDDVLPPLGFFQDPLFEGPTPFRVEFDSKHVFGHGALFGSCHLGYSDRCVEAPRSERGYNHFRTGAVMTDGGLVSVGQITMDTGHPPLHYTASEAVRHYDDTGTVVADVAAGEDQWGIWLNGMLRPGVTNAQARALQAATISGDWRSIGGKAEFVAALAVNVPGFPIPRPELAASAYDPDAIQSMVAVGVVQLDPNALDPDRVASLVVSKLTARDRRAARVRALQDDMRRVRLEALHDLLR